MSTDQNADAVTVLATALDNLGARIYRDLHVESSDAEVTEAVLADFSTYAEECLAALDNPVVKQALESARAASTATSAAAARKQAAEEIRARSEIEHAAYPDDRFYQGMHAAADLLDPEGAERARAGGGQ